jgi:mycoredoxin-dependent peroxiredoxin
MRGLSTHYPGVLPATGELAGELAPDFDLPALVRGVKRRFHLKEQVAHKNIVLAFYPLNWESVSARQLVEYREEAEQFRSCNAEVVTICVDSIMNTTVWEREIGPFDYVLCSDFWPHGEVGRAYGLFCEEGPQAGTSQRAVFVVKRGGPIVFGKVYDWRELPPISKTFEALRGL